MKNFDTFIDQIIKDKGFADKDPEIVAQIKEDLSKRLVTRVNAMIATTMPERAVDGFLHVLESNDDDTIMAYVRQHIADIDDKVAAVLVEFKTTYLS